MHSSCRWPTERLSPDADTGASRPCVTHTRTQCHRHAPRPSAHSRQRGPVRTPSTRRRRAPTRAVRVCTVSERDLQHRHLLIAGGAERIEIATHAALKQCRILTRVARHTSRATKRPRTCGMIDKRARRSSRPMCAMLMPSMCVVPATARRYITTHVVRLMRTSELDESEQRKHE
jgi:hypothetical protein